MRPGNKPMPGYLQTQMIRQKVLPASDRGDAC